MGVSSALRELARFLDACEAERGTVSAVQFDADPQAERRRLTATVELSLSTCPTAANGGTLDLQNASVADDGRLQLAFDSPAVVPTAGHDVDLDVADATLDEDGTVTVTLEASVRTDDRAIADGVPIAGGRSETAEADETIEASEASEEVADESEVSPTASANGSGARVVGADTQATDTQATDTQATDTQATDTQATDTQRAETPDVKLETNGENQSIERGASTADRSARRVPPFRNRELLAEVYESCDTFAEMTEALGMDVTAETVRRYMIDHGIHEPNSYNTSASSDDSASSTDDDAGTTGDSADSADDIADSADDSASGTDDAQAPVVLADGIGLPDDVTVDELIETVKRSNTIYEVTRDIGMERQEALTMLRELDLLDLVVGRLAAAERDISREDVIDRLRQVAATH